MQDTQEMMEVEFNSVEINTEEWETAAAVTARPVPDSQDSRQDSQRNELLTLEEKAWLRSDTFDNIPSPLGTQSPDTVRNSQEEQEDRQADLIDAGYELAQQKEAIIEMLRGRLEDAMSLKDEYWEKMQELDLKISNLEGETRRLAGENHHLKIERDRHKTPEEMNVIKQQLAVAQAEAAALSVRATSAEINEANIKTEVLNKEAQLKRVQKDALAMMDRAKEHTAQLRRQSEADKAKDKEMEEAKKAEIERLKTINIQTEGAKRAEIGSGCS